MNLADSDTSNPVRVRLDLAYRGTDFAGWAVQPGLRTVQGTLEDALGMIVRSDDGQPGNWRLTVAGRTDAGVHARGQVTHVDLPRAAWLALPGRSDRSPAQALVDRLQGVLPRDVVVQAAELASPGFDARFSALRRHYVYRIADTDRARDPLRADWTFWSRRSLDVAAMDEAARPLLGLHDFAAFCKPRPGATTIRELQQFTWQRMTSGPDEGLVIARVSADAFCHNMVRALVGASLVIGEGRQGSPWLAELLRAKVRNSSGGVVAANGLTLEGVEYPAADQLAERATQIRARRMDEEVLG